jgi:DNA gyrase/topoisomerase IV subunit B
MQKQYNDEDIQALTAGEAVRARPQLYFQKCFQEASLDSLPFEALCHAFDEYFDNACSQINITVNNGAFTVWYNAGISLDLRDNGLSKAELMMTQLFTCKNEKKHPAVGHAFCSVGMATINFAAERCELTTVCNGKKGHFIFENGATVSATIHTAADERAFTEIFMQPAKLLFPNLRFTAKGIEEKARQICDRLKGLEIIIVNNL